MESNTEYAIALSAVNIVGIIKPISNNEHANSQAPIPNNIP